MKKYKLYIRKYNFLKNNYETIEKEVLTNDLYHEIGYIYCTSLEHIKRIDYMEIKPEEREKKNVSNDIKINIVGNNNKVTKNNINN